MKSLLTTVCLVIVFTFGTLPANAQQTPTTPLEFNDYLVSVTDSLYEMGREWGRKFNEVNQSKKYGELSSSRKQMESYIKRKQVLVTRLKNIGGSEELKKAQLDFLALELQIVKDAFIPLEKLTASSSDAEIKYALDNLRTLSAREDESLQKVIAAQVAYGKKNGFRVEGATDETDE